MCRIEPTIDLWPIFCAWVAEKRSINRETDGLTETDTLTNKFLNHQVLLAEG